MISHEQQFLFSKIVLEQTPKNANISAKTLVVVNYKSSIKKILNSIDGLPSGTT